MFDDFPPKSVIAAIDGSPSAVSAAVWAAQEAVHHDFPFRIVYIIENRDSDPITRDGALTAVRAAYRVVIAECGPVKAELEVVHGNVTRTLVELSRSAWLMSIGSPSRPRFGMRAESIAAEVVPASHCPVALIRERVDASRRRGGMIVALLGDDCDDCDVLQQALHEAQLRRAPLSLTRRCVSMVAADRVAQSREDFPPLPAWTSDYPDVRADLVTLHESFTGYVTHHAADIDLVVIGADCSAEVEELIGPRSPAVLRNCGVNVLVVNRQHL